MTERDRTRINDEAIAALKRKMKAQWSEIREALAEDLGGDPEDYLQRDE